MFVDFCCVCQITIATMLGVCDFCWQILPWAGHNKYACLRCLTILPVQESLYCGDCQQHLQAQRENISMEISYNRLLTVFAYQQPVQQLLLDLKFKQK